ncbi:MAG: hypothetical protein QNI91_05530 [Arenicellales bacterium]|nr:hypothetical protein [Arenicellales bacterium]
MKTIVWVLYVVISNANGDPYGVAEMETVFESKEACKQKAVAMRLYTENYGCRPMIVASS